MMENKIIKIKMTDAGQWKIETNYTEMIEVSIEHLDQSVPYGYSYEIPEMFLGTFVEGFDPHDLIDIERKVS